MSKYEVICKNNRSNDFCAIISGNVNVFKSMVANYVDESIIDGANELMFLSENDGVHIVGAKAEFYNSEVMLSYIESAINSKMFGYINIKSEYTSDEMCILVCDNDVRCMLKIVGTDYKMSKECTELIDVYKKLRDRYGNMVYDLDKAKSYEVQEFGKVSYGNSKLAHYSVEAQTFAEVCEYYLVDTFSRAELVCEGNVDYILTGASVTFDEDSDNEWVLDWYRANGVQQSSNGKFYAIQYVTNRSNDFDKMFYPILFINCWCKDEDLSTLMCYFDYTLN